MEFAEVIATENQLTASFEPNDAKIYSSFEVDEHYNLVAKCSSQLQRVLTEQQKDLLWFDEIITTNPKNYHTTVLSFPLTSLGSDVSERLRELSHTPLCLTVQGIHIRPTGIYANAYSPDNQLGNLRAKVADVVGEEFDKSDRLANIGWIALARFTNRPSWAIIKWSQSRVDTNFGQLEVIPQLYRSNNRQRLGKRIWS